MKIYTRKGDDGTTGLWYGGRVSKSDARPEAYGALDEAASAVRMCRPVCDDRLEADIDRSMERVDLPPKFVIPGGTEISARREQARTAMRRAERRTVDLDVRTELLTYLNRASDAVYAIARYTDEPDPQLFGGRS